MIISKTQLKDFFFDKFENFDVATRHKNLLASEWGDRYEELYNDNTDEFIGMLSRADISFSEFAEFISDNF